MRNNKQGREGPAIISGADSKKKKKKRESGLHLLRDALSSCWANECLHLLSLPVSRRSPLVRAYHFIVCIDLGNATSARKTKELLANSFAIVIPLGPIRSPLFANSFS